MVFRLVLFLKVARAWRIQLETLTPAAVLGSEESEEEGDPHMAERPPSSDSSDAEFERIRRQHTAAFAVASKGRKARRDELLAYGEQADGGSTADTEAGSTTTRMTRAWHK